MNYKIVTLNDLINLAFKIPDEGMQTHYVPGPPNRIIKPAHSEIRVYVKGSPLYFICEEGTFICPSLPKFEKILRSENFMKANMENPFPRLSLPSEYYQCIKLWNVIKSQFNAFYYKTNDSNEETSKDLVR